MTYLQLEFPFFLIAVIANVALAAIVWYFASRDISRKLFSSFVLSQVLWIVVNYIAFKVPEQHFLLLARLTLFFACFHAFFFFLFIRSFLAHGTILGKKLFIPLVALLFIIAGLTMSPLVFTGLQESSTGEIAPIPGPAIPTFGVFVGALVLATFYTLIRRFRSSKGMERIQWRFLAIGLATTFILVLAFSFFNFILRGDLSTVRLGHLYTLPFVIFTTYAMVRHNLLNVKVILAELSVLLLNFVLIVQVLSSQTTSQLVINGVVFIGVLIFSVLLIRGVLQEVAQRHKLEILTKDLQVANDRLKELDDLKTDFISIASHQLRTPLTAIKGYTSMILEGDYGESPLKIRGVVEKVFQSAQRLIFIVNDLLDVSRIEQGRLQLAFEKVKVVNVLKDAMDELKGTAERKGIELELKVSVEDAELIVNADFSKIRQVFTNFIDNSIKYTPKGWVHVTMERQKDRVLLSVKDSGIGMTEDTKSKLFQKFSRARGVTKFRADGSGLGLYIAKEIVKAHGGEVWAESEGEGKGSQFYVSLPLHNPAAEAIRDFAEGM